MDSPRIPNGFRKGNPQVSKRESIFFLVREFIWSPNEGSFKFLRKIRFRIQSRIQPVYLKLFFHTGKFKWNVMGNVCNTLRWRSKVKLCLVSDNLFYENREVTLIDLPINSTIDSKLSWWVYVNFIFQIPKLYDITSTFDRKDLATLAY